MTLKAGFDIIILQQLKSEAIKICKRKLGRAKSPRTNPGMSYVDMVHEYRVDMVAPDERARWKRAKAVD